MSTRDDARLTAQERAVLSNLEASASADDPQLAARLRGPSRWRVSPRLRVLPGWVRGPWVAAAAILLGLGLALLAVSVGWFLGVIGAVVAALGLSSGIGHVEARWKRRIRPEGGD